MASGGAIGWRSVLAILLTILAMFVASMPSVTVAQTAEEEQAVACPHPEWWVPADLARILAEHGKWAEREGILRNLERMSFRQGRANLCNANLYEAQLNNADLRRAQLNNADLSGAQLNNANLAGAQLNNANLSGAKLNNANLAGPS